MLRKIDISCRAANPFSRPCPDFFIPPKGSLIPTPGAMVVGLIRNGLHTEHRCEKPSLAASSTICGRWRQHEKKHSQCASMPEPPMHDTWFDDAITEREDWYGDAATGRTQRFRCRPGMHGHEPRLWRAARGRIDCHYPPRRRTRRHAVRHCRSVWSL